MFVSGMIEIQYGTIIIKFILLLDTNWHERAHPVRYSCILNAICWLKNNRHAGKGNF